MLLQLKIEESQNFLYCSRHEGMSHEIVKSTFSISQKIGNIWANSFLPPSSRLTIRTDLMWGSLSKPEKFRKVSPLLRLPCPRPAEVANHPKMRRGVPRISIYLFALATSAVQSSSTWEALWLPVLDTFLFFFFSFPFYFSLFSLSICQRIETFYSNWASFYWNAQNVVRLPTVYEEVSHLVSLLLIDTIIKSLKHPV